MSRRRATLGRVLASENLRRLELAFSAFGMAEYGVWVAVLVYAFQRGGATLAGVIAVIQLLPAAVVAPLAARHADRRGPATALRWGYASQAVTLAVTSVALLADLPSLVVYVGAVAAASEVTLIRPAQSSLLPALVSEPGDLTAANAVSGWVESISMLVGPALAGAMIAVDGPGAALAVFAGSMFVGTVLIAPLRGAGAEPEEDDETTLRAVAAVLRADTGVTTLLGLISVQSIALGALDVLEVVLAVNVLGLGGAGAGYLGAAFGAGGSIGAIGALSLIGRPRLSPAIVGAAAVFGGCFIALGIWPSVAAAFSLLCIVGASHTVIDVAGRSILHRVIPAAIRGRVFGIQEGLMMLGLAIGAIAVPPLVHAGGAEAALVTLGALLVVTTVALASVIAGVERVTPVPAAQLAALRRSELFGMLAAPVLEDLARALVERTVGAGEVVVREGDPGDLFYLVAGGDLDVSVADRYVHTITAGDGFGEIALLRDGIRTATVTARTPATLYALTRGPFLEAITGSPSAQQAAEAVVADRLARA